MKNEAKLKEWGLDKWVRYYYLNFTSSRLGLGTATVCVILVSDAMEGVRYARGVSFCSPKDQFNKKLGRTIALGRAVKAIEKRLNSDHISTTMPALVLRREYGWTTLSEWGALLTDYEEHLFGVEGEG